MTSEKMNVSGVAVRAGLSLNRIFYSENELEKFSKTVAKRPILKDHDYRTDSTIGKVVKSKFNDNAVEYAGWVVEDGTNLLEKIKDGRISEVSIGAVAGRLCKENEDDDFFIVKDLRCMEISLTPTPATVGTSLTQTLKQLESIEKPSDMKKVKPVLENVAMINASFDIKEEREAEEVVEEETEEKSKVYCPYCERGLASLEQLRKHLKKHKEEVGEEETKKEENIQEKLKHNEEVIEMVNETIKPKVDEKKAEKLLAKEKELSEREEALKVKEQEMTDKRISELTDKYKGLCEERKLEARDTTKVSEDVLKILIEEVEKVPVKEDAEEDKPDDKADEKNEEKPDDKT